MQAATNGDLCMATRGVATAIIPNKGKRHDACNDNEVINANPWNITNTTTGKLFELRGEVVPRILDRVNARRSNVPCSHPSSTPARCLGEMIAVLNVDSHQPIRITGTRG